MMPFNQWWYDFKIKNGGRLSNETVAQAAWAASRIEGAPLPEGRDKGDAEKWRIAIDLPPEENDIFYGGDFNSSTLKNAVYAALRRREPQEESQ